MEILDNKAVLIKTRNPAKYTVIPKSRIVEDHGNGGYTVAVFFGLDEMRVLKNLGVKHVVSPITRKYNWPGRYRPMSHQVDTASFLTLNRRAFCFNEPGCVDADTEYLSPTGWKRIADYNGGEVAQYHPETGAAEFVVPQEFVKLPCEDMVRIKTKYGLDQMLSPEHRTLIHSNAADKWCVMEAAEVLKAHDDWHAGAKRPRSSKTVSFSHMAIPTVFNIEHGTGMDMSEAQLRVQVAVIADGHFANSTTRCVVRLKRQRKVTRLRALLSNAGIAYAEREQNTPTAQGFHVFTFNAPQRCKEFGQEFWSCNAAQRAVIGDEVKYWDGTVREGNKGASFSTTSRASADFIQYVWASLGRTARITEDVRDHYRNGVCYTVQARGGTKGGRFGLLALKSRDKTTVSTAKSTDGFKYCFMVPSTFLLFRRNGCVFASGNTGKTLSALWAADYLMKRGEVRRVLILCPLSIMHSAWMGDIMNSVMHRSAVVAHHAQSSRRIELVQGDYEFVIANYEGLNLINKEVLNDGRFDLVIVDECFVAGTPVATPLGNRPIEQLEAGNEVLTSDGVMRIKRLVRNTATQLVEVKLGNGKSIQCTPEHPFFTDAGWVCAKNLAGRRLVSGVELSRLRGGIPPQKSADALVSIEGDSGWGYLFQILRTEEVAPNESRSQLLQPHFARSTGENVGAEDARTSGEAISSSESQRAQTDCARGQRYGNDTDGAVDFRGLTCGVGMELPSSVGQEAARLSYELQARLCVATPQGGVGSGRGQSHPVSAASAGSEEGSQAGGAWVESVSYIECPNGEPVYNLEVEGTPNYFVGDHWLVHNCNAYKNPSTQRWKSLHSIIQPNTYLWMMTGTPASQSPLDAYGLAKLVNPGGVPKFYTAWRDKVMNKLTQFKWAPKPNAKVAIHEALQPAIRFTKEQCLDLPPVITVTREVALSPQQTKYYKLLKEQMLVQAAGETISAVNAGVMVSKLLQVSCGAAYTDDKEVVEFDASARLKVLMEVVEETDRKVIIFAMFRSSINTIVTYLEKHNIKTAQIHGDVSATKRGVIINDFQHTPNVQVLVMQPQATAHGITLTAADTVIFYGPLMSVEMYLQCIARADRKGQDSDKVTVVHIQSSPIEQKMFKAMAAKVSDHALLVGLFDSEVKNS